MEMTKQEEIEKAVKTCIAIEWDEGKSGFNGNRLTQKILEVQSILGVVIKMDAHRSDCAVHNEPAYPAGWCDCGLLSNNSSIVAVEPLIKEG